MKTVAILCASLNSVYHEMDGVMVYDRNRDARTFPGDMPIVAHPPCRSWSAFCCHQAKPKEGEQELGLWCCEKLRQCGGVLEQPAYSRLWDVANFPKPGDLASSGIWSIAVQQYWFGYPTKRGTWLAICGTDRLPEIPYRLNAERTNRERWNRQSKTQRSATTRSFAEWLVEVARSTYVE